VFGFVACFKRGFPYCLRGPLGLSPTPPALTQMRGPPGLAEPSQAYSPTERAWIRRRAARSSTSSSGVPEKQPPKTPLRVRPSAAGSVGAGGLCINGGRGGRQRRRGSRRRRSTGARRSQRGPLQEQHPRRGVVLHR
jgi:hypothetical protein